MKFIDIFKGDSLHGGFFGRAQSYYLGRPDIMSSGGWTKWEEDTKKKHPIKWFILETVPDFVAWTVWGPISRRIYNLKCKYWRKYHHIKIDVDRFFVDYECSDKPIENYTWIDVDTKILYSSFQILVDYVEKESDIVDWAADPKHTEIEEEFMVLYRWWTKERSKRVDDYPSMSDYGLEGGIGNIDRNTPGYKRWQEAHDEYTKQEAEYDNEDSEMLIRLITIRRSLWS